MQLLLGRCKGPDDRSVWSFNVGDSPNALAMMLDTCNGDLWLFEFVHTEIPFGMSKVVTVVADCHSCVVLGVFVVLVVSWYENSASLFCFRYERLKNRTFDKKPTTERTSVLREYAVACSRIV